MNSKLEDVTEQIKNKIQNITEEIEMQVFLFKFCQKLKSKYVFVDFKKGLS